MLELQKEEFFPKAHAFTGAFADDPAYPLSVLTGRQTGRVFVDRAEAPAAALVWHCCGFAYLAGTPDAAMHSAVADLIACRYAPDQPRFLLHVYDEAEAAAWRALPDTETWIQYLYDMDAAALRRHYASVPDGFLLCEASQAEIQAFPARIAPAFSWTATDDFLHDGKAFCLLCAGSGEVAAMAFTAAIGGGTVDIGITTDERFRGQGLGRIVASRTSAYAFDCGLRPVWRCAAGNPASARVAESVGFHKVSEHAVCMKRRAPAPTATH